MTNEIKTHPTELHRAEAEATRANLGLSRQIGHLVSLRVALWTFFQAEARRAALEGAGLDARLAIATEAGAILTRVSQITGRARSAVAAIEAVGLYRPEIWLLARNAVIDHPFYSSLVPLAEAALEADYPAVWAVLGRVRQASADHEARMEAAQAILRAEAERNAPVRLLADLRLFGIEIAADAAGNITAPPGTILTIEQRANVLRYKTALVDLLRAEAKAKAAKPMVLA